MDSGLKGKKKRRRGAILEAIRNAQIPKRTVQELLRVLFVPPTFSQFHLPVIDFSLIRLDESFHN